MANLVCQVREFEGKVYAVHSSTSWTEPVRTELWWELACDTGLFTEGCQAVWDGSLNLFEVESPRVGESFRQVHPQNRSREAQAERVLRFDVPPPKTKLQTRWHQGAWQRYTAKGWR